MHQRWRTTMDYTTCINCGHTTLAGSACINQNCNQSPNYIPPKPKSPPRRPETRSTPTPARPAKPGPTARSGKDSAQNWKWTLIGALGGGGWAFTQFDGEGRWWIIGSVSLVTGFIVGRFHRLLIILALIFAAIWAYGWYISD